jgi:hypothetical protein
VSATEQLRPTDRIAQAVQTVVVDHLAKPNKSAPTALLHMHGAARLSLGLRQDADIGLGCFPALRVLLLASSSDTEPAMIMSSPPGLSAAGCPFRLRRSVPAHARP